jgi:hypothetical protein
MLPRGRQLASKLKVGKLLQLLQHSGREPDAAAAVATAQLVESKVLQARKL